MFTVAAMDWASPDFKAVGRSSVTVAATGTASPTIVNAESDAT